MILKFGQGSTISNRRKAGNFASLGESVVGSLSDPFVDDHRIAAGVKNRRDNDRSSLDHKDDYKRKFIKMAVRN